MVLGVIVAVMMGFTAGNVVTVQNPELYNFTKDKIDNYDPAGKHSVVKH